ncbi:MAG: PKD domain-containing protein [Paramuribaculum sp.]|nr:PKD domain-containing protein [Paramuribaculum sp.]
MAKTLFSWLSILSAILVGGMLISCNKDDIIAKDTPPRIILDSETAVYEVKAGKELIIAPKYENADNATFVWKVDDEVKGSGASFTAVWSKPGTYYVNITVITDGGRASEDIRVEVIEPGIPYISLPFTGNEVYLKAGTDYMLTPEIANFGSEGLNTDVEWSLNGKPYSTGTTFHFSTDETGDYIVSVKSTNEDGTDERQFIIHVVYALPFTLEFPSVSYFNSSTRRFTFPGRTIMLRPIVAGIEANSYEWTVNGKATGSDTEVFAFTPDAPGEYVVNLTVDGSVSASVIVECVNATEESRWRRAVGASKAKCNKVFEWVPAPGQFIGETQTGGMTGNETTHESAILWAEQRLGKEQYVSLGGFGGYIIVGFDHSIENTETGYDFSIQANAYFNLATGNGGSNEPGIVYVSQDVNGNGLPDDEWYELRGSETGKPETIQDYAVTYYRPSAPKMSVQWTDCLGQSGAIDYLAAFHRQDYYYPAWITEDSYTLRGTRLKARTTQNSETGMWDNNCFEWGYADNMGSDVLSSNDNGGGEGQRNGFLIKNAMYISGAHINLKYIDFIRVQTGVNSKAGWLGEVSTEVFGFEDLKLVGK